MTHGCMVYTELAPRRQQFHVAPAMPAPKYTTSMDTQQAIPAPLRTAAAEIRLILICKWVCWYFLCRVLSKPRQDCVQLFIPQMIDHISFWSFMIYCLSLIFSDHIATVVVIHRPLVSPSRHRSAGHPSVHLSVNLSIRSFRSLIGAWFKCKRYFV